MRSLLAFGMLSPNTGSHAANGIAKAKFRQSLVSLIWMSPSHVGAHMFKQELITHSSNASLEPVSNGSTDAQDAGHFSINCQLFDINVMKNNTLALSLPSSPHLNLIRCRSTASCTVARNFLCEWVPTPSSSSSAASALNCSCGQTIFSNLFLHV